MRAIVQGRLNEVVSIDTPAEEWLELQREHEGVRRRLPGARLCTCPTCGHGLHPKRLTANGTQFFAHDPNPPDDCPLKIHDHESPEHRRLKVTIYRAARHVRGWDAKIEQPAPEPDPITEKPIVVDVVAMRNAAAQTRRSQAIGNVQGWEVQRGGIGEASVLEAVMA